MDSKKLRFCSGVVVWYLNSNLGRRRNTFRTRRQLGYGCMFGQLYHRQRKVTG